MVGIMLRACNTIFKVLCLLSLSSLSGCADNEDDRKWGVFSEAIEREIEQPQKEVNISDLIDLFLNKHRLMMSVVATCETNPKIRRIGIKDGSTSFYGKSFSGPEFETATDSTRLALSELSSSSVSCGRRGDFDGDPLAIVSFVMYASGISVSGSSLGILYRTEWSRTNNPVTKEQVKARGHTALPKEGWYVYKN